MESLNGKITGGTLTAAEFNQIANEMENIILNLGIVLTSADVNQVGKAIAGYIQNGNFWTDSGIADAYVCTTIGLKQNPTAYTDGMFIRFLAGNTNTGATTVNVAGLGIRNVFISGVACTGGEIVANEYIDAVYDLANTRFELLTANAAAISANTSHSTGDGSDHADVATNTADIASIGLPLSGSFTASGVLTNDGAGGLIAHGAGTDDIIIDLTAVGSVDEAWVVGVNTVALGGKLIQGDLSGNDSVDTTVAAATTANFRYRVTNRSGGTQDITVYWSVRKR